MTAVPASKIRKRTPTMLVPPRELTPAMVCVNIGRTLPPDIIHAIRMTCPSATILVYATP